MMRSAGRSSWGAVALIAWQTAADARGQMFGPRTLGGSLSRRATPGGDVGTLSGNERFLRGNRAARDFVGTDRGDRRFVGVPEGTAATLRSSVSNLRPAAEPAVNQPVTPAANNRSAPYEPRLSLGFAVRERSPREVEQALEDQLARSFATARWGQIEVSVAGQTAILRGAVASAQDRRLAQAWALLEPGIDDVQNELRVTGSPPETGVLPEAVPPR